MTFEKRVPSEFSIIVPRDNDMFWLKQGGGMSPTQYSLEGVYIPIGSLSYRLGYPEWAPEGTDFEDKLQNVNISEIPERDRNSLPLPVTDRRQFKTSDEYFNWVDESEWYGSVDLWDDLYRFTYGIFDLLDSDPRKRWDDEGDLWDAIDTHLGFYYRELSYDEFLDAGLDGYPRPEAAIRPIKMRGSKTSSRGRKVAPWADELEDEIVFLMCPNAD